MNLFEQIALENADCRGPAVIDRGMTCSYPELLNEVRAFASVLRENGVVPPARVGILADDSYEYIAASLAVLSLNAAIVPLSTRASAEELRAMPESVGLHFLLCGNAYRKPEDKPLPVPEHFREEFFLRNYRRAVQPISLPGGNIPAFIRFSSGTTGTSKGVVISHKSVLERTAACTGLGVTRGEHVLWVLDMAFHFVVTILLFLRKGAVIVICGQPIERGMAEALRTWPIRLLYATPYHYRLMTRSPEYSSDSLKQVRLAVSTAMKLEAADAEAFQAKFHLPLSQAYGIIEVGLPCLNSTDRPEKSASAGRLQEAYRIRIDRPDAEGNGDILIQGPGMFDAYLTPFRTREELCPDGWFRTGDIGHLDGERYLFIVGRSKNVINFAGMKIFPYEVESVLNEHELVRESLVRGIPAPGFGELPVAEIVPAAEMPPDWTELLRKYCFSRLAPYKVPKQFRLVGELPRTASGKLRRS